MVMLAQETESSLVMRAQAGDRSAYSELVRRHHRSTINVVYRMCGDSQLAEDAAQEAFIKAWQRLNSYEQRSTFRSWLFRIAVNTAIDMLRREPAAVEMIENNMIASTETRPERAVEQAELSRQVQQAVLMLPEASRAVLVLREFEGFSYQEIATALDIPLGTVMSRLNYARNKLRQMLRPQISMREEANEG